MFVSDARNCKFLVNQSEKSGYVHIGCHAIQQISVINIWDIQKTFFPFSLKFNDKENLQLINDFPARLFIGYRNSKAQEFIVTFYSILLKIIWSLFLDELK